MIREMLPTERQDVLDLLLKCRETDYADEKGFFSFTSDQVLHVLDKNDTTFVAVEDGEIVGTVALSGPSCGSLVVREDYRKRGIGAALLDAAVERAGNLRFLAVAVPATHDGAKRAFSRAGFTPVGVIMERTQ